MNESIFSLGKQSFQKVISVPGDKSISHRGVILGALANGHSRLENFLMSEDCLNTVECFKSMGIIFSQQKPHTLLIEGKGLWGLKQPKETLFVGNSGTSIRLLSGVLAGQSFSSVIEGDASIAQRPMRRVIIPLSQMGASIQSRKGGLAPLRFESSRLKGIVYHNPVSSAQVKSCLLLAGLYADGQTTVTEKPISRDHTERLFISQGIPVKMERKGYRQSVSVKNFSCGSINPLSLVIPGDISSALFFIVATLISKGSKLVLKNIGLNPTRIAILDVLKKMGASINVVPIETDGEAVGDLYVKHSVLKGIVIKGSCVSKIIDEIPILSIAFSQAQGVSRVSDAQELRVKESDRISGIVQMLRSLGAKISEHHDGFTVTGQHSLKGGVVDSGHDHRIAMSAAIASVCCESSVKVLKTQCIHTSFPSFFEQYESLFCKS